MLSKHFYALACGLTIGLGGCAAAPLAQIAVSHMAAPQGGSGGGTSQGVADAVRKLTGAGPDAGAGAQPVAGAAQSKPVGAQAADAMPSFSDLSHGISGSFHKLIGDGADTQTLVTGSPAK